MTGKSYLQARNYFASVCLVVGVFFFVLEKKGIFLVFLMSYILYIFYLSEGRIFSIDPNKKHPDLGTETSSLLEVKGQHLQQLSDYVCLLQEGKMREGV